MTTRTISTLTTSILTSLALVGCAEPPADLDEESAALVGDGYATYEHSSTSDPQGRDLSAEVHHACVLAGVAGNLANGAFANTYGGVKQRPAMAVVGDRYPTTGHPWLIAHGGSHQNQYGNEAWTGKRVRAQASCFYANGYSAAETLVTQGVVKLADLSVSRMVVRQCFLIGLEGVDASWNQPTFFARVVKRTTTDATHPTTGWYLEGDMNDGDSIVGHPHAHAACIDFPGGTTVTTGTVYSNPDMSTTWPIAGSTGLKACGLTGVTGAFDVDSDTDGALMTLPTTPEGMWLLTTRNGKSASWACVR